MANLPGGQKATKLDKVKQPTLRKAQGKAKPGVSGGMKGNPKGGTRGNGAKNAGMC